MPVHETASARPTMVRTQVLFGTNCESSTSQPRALVCRPLIRSDSTGSASFKSLCLGATRRARRSLKLNSVKELRTVKMLGLGASSTPS